MALAIERGFPSKEVFAQSEALCTFSKHVSSLLDPSGSKVGLSEFLKLIASKLRDLMNELSVAEEIPVALMQLEPADIVSIWEETDFQYEPNRAANF